MLPSFPKQRDENMNTKSQQEKTAEFIDTILSDAMPGARCAFTELLESCILISKALENGLKETMHVGVTDEMPVGKTEETPENGN